MHANDSNQPYKYSWCERAHVIALGFYYCDAVFCLGYTFCALTFSSSWLKRIAENNRPRKEWTSVNSTNNRNQTKRETHCVTTSTVVVYTKNMCNLFGFFTWNNGTNGLWIRVPFYSGPIHSRLYFARYIYKNHFIYKSLRNRTKIFWKLHLCHIYVIVEWMIEAEECSQMSRMNIFFHLKS